MKIPAGFQCQVGLKRHMENCRSLQEMAQWWPAMGVCHWCKNKGPQGHRARAAAVGSMGFSNHGVRPVEHPVNGKHGQLDVCFSYFCWETHGGELGVEHGLKK